MARVFLTRRHLLYLALITSALSLGIFAVRIAQKVQLIRNLYAAGGDVPYWSEPPKYVRRYFGDRIADLLSSPKAVRFDGESGDPDKLNDQLLSEVVKLPTLSRLSLHKCSVNGQAFGCIPASSEITEMLVVDCPIEDDAVRHLIHLKGLHRLNLSGSRITSNSVKSITQISSLELFSAWDTALSETDKRLIEAKLPNCEVLIEPLANPEKSRRDTKPFREKLPHSYDFSF